MGLFRYALSLTVVMFHCGDWSAVSGRTAVFLFYCLSGYLMALVIDRTYGTSPSGALRFWLNRALRILPPYAFWVAISILLVLLRGHVGFDVESPEEPNRHFPIDPDVPGRGWLAIARELAFAMRVNLEALVVTSSPDVVEQAWSLGVECSFYLLAPLLWLLWMRARWLFALVAAASFGLGLYLLATLGTPAFDDRVYRNVLTSLFVFQLGMVAYGIRPKEGPTLRWAMPGALALLAAYLMLVGGDGVTRRYVEGFYAILPLGIAIVALLSRADRLPEPVATLDRAAGHLAYGVFLCHYVAMFLLFLSAEWIYETTGAFGVFGRYNRTAFGVWTCALSTLLAAGSFFLVERPIERIRDRVRGRTERRALRASPAAPAEHAA
jgi:peptidoglycan/LPS O-acetylase OafA/YrhL